MPGPGLNKLGSIPAIERLCGVTNLRNGLLCSPCMEPASRPTFSPAGAGGVLVGTTATGVGVGALIGWAAGSTGIGALVGR